MSHHHAHLPPINESTALHSLEKPKSSSGFGSSLNYSLPRNFDKKKQSTSIYKPFLASPNCPAGFSSFKK
jgi:hypothetical protein